MIPDDIHFTLSYQFWFFGEPAEGDKALKIFDDLVAQSNGTIIYSYREKKETEIFDWRFELINEVSFLSSRLIQEENLASKESR